MGTFNGRFIKRSLDTRNLEHAAFLIRQIELGKVVTARLNDACKRFVAEGLANGLSPETISKHKLLTRELEAFFGKCGSAFAFY